MLVRDLEDRTDLILVTDSQDIEAIQDSTGLDLSEYGCLLVAIGEGEYTEVYGIESSVPWLSAYVEEVKLNYNIQDYHYIDQ